jgi:hypothetical protein
MKPLVIGYFTENTPYAHEAEVLKLSLVEHGYEHDILPVANLGSWQKNTQYKAQVIKSFLKKYPGRPLLYLDVDAIMVKPPVVLDELPGTCHIAACHYGTSTELLSGTVWFSGDPACLVLVDRWMALNKMYPEKLPNRMPAWDQRTLEMAIKETGGIIFQELPQEYTYITELTSKVAPDINPVILHTRGAKRFKNQINGEEGYAT